MLDEKIKSKSPKGSFTLSFDFHLFNFSINDFLKTFVPHNESVRLIDISSEIIN